MVSKRSPEEIRENDIVNFIVQVRKLSCQSTDLARNMMRIKNLANTIFRHYIGYTARGEYRLKAKDERCFADDLEKKGIRRPFGRMRSVNPNLDNLSAAEMVKMVESSLQQEPSSDVEFVDLSEFDDEGKEKGAANDERSRAESEQDERSRAESEQDERSRAAEEDGSRDDNNSQ